MSTSNTPPQVHGLPLIGNILDFRKDPVAFFREARETHGPVFAIKLANKPGAVVVGAEETRFILEQTDKLFSIREAYPFFKPMFQDDILFLADEEEHAEQRRIFLKAFQGRKFRRYVTAMAEEVDAWLDTLGEEGEFDMVRVFGELTMYIAARAFLGDSFRQEMGGQYYDLFRDLSAGMEFVIPPNWPLPRFKRRDRAKAALHEMIGAIMAQRRAAPGVHEDFLQELIEATYSDGRPLADGLIINMILALTWAGHETTAAQVAWVLVQLLQHPDYLEAVVAEIDGALPAGAPLTQPVLQELLHQDWALKETERMRTITAMLLRVVKEPVTLGGFDIPAGWLLFICPPLTHNDPTLFGEPEVYNPYRFAPEGDDQAAGNLFGFGGGTHRCLGASFARTEMKVILTRLLQRYELTLVDPDPQPDPDVVGAVPPAMPCLVRYRRRAGQPAGAVGLQMQTAATS